ncbi:MAG: hypothetical protein WAV04_01755 [Candidatus Microsaccharimonas sp.]|jgi:FtsZ-interacting cell division protein ZipA
MSIFNGWRITRAGVVFVAGIIILAGLVFGGIWLVNQRGEQARRDEAIKIAEQQLQEQSEVAAETNSEPVQAEETQTNTATSTSANAAELPATGPELMQLLAIALLALSVGYYVTSRRARAQL